MAHQVLQRQLVTRVHLRRFDKRGFTLVELGAVVVIVGILAIVAVVGYRRLITASHSSEATHMINAVRVAQEAYKSETGAYADISTALGYVTSAGPQNAASMYPNTNVGSFKTGWGAACGNCTCTTSPCAAGTARWDTLPVHTDGAVMYGYTTVGGPSGALTTYSGNTAPSSITLMGRTGTYTVTFVAPQADWYMVSAVGDPDGNGLYSSYTGTSFSNDIFDSNDGE
jgi:type IV pilus assembly protein PilA